ncbi:MAG: hypothetical protein J6N50_10010 [Bacteroidales bacterium]|nr:hypothetical protein [Bacteroidales bacterium]MDO4999796.1 hypothetical protein [Bacteroidales bacterium]
MKDIVITRKTIRRELLILGGCFLFAVLFDLFAIIKFSRPFVELFTTIGYELAITLVVYLVTVLVRALVWGIRALFVRGKGK